MKAILRSGFLALAILLGFEAGAGIVREQEIYTLYRNSPTDRSMRLHVATFDSDEGYDDPEYNLENCQHAAQLFTEQPPMDWGKSLVWWCEQGRYRE